MKNFLFFLLMLVATLAPAQNYPPFSRGVNLTSWFQVSDIQHMTFGKYDETDFANIKSLGADVVRLPVDLKGMIGPAPDYTVNPVFFLFMDQTVAWAEKNGLHLILDNHNFDPSIPTAPTVATWLIPAWKQIATHYQGKYPNLSFEILNEPHAITAAIWNPIQTATINAIRAIDKDRWIIAGPVDYNSYSQLASLPVVTDKKIIYTFHFYDPFLLTHQGASWTDPSLESLQGIPYPYDAARMPVLPAVYKGTWIENTFNNYKNEGNDTWVRNVLNAPANFRKSRKMPLFCGEFGVYGRYSPTEDRARWYETVSKKLEADSIAWTIWDYQGEFGLFVPKSSERFFSDLNLPVVAALGFTAPTQLPWVRKPDSAGISIYSDWIKKGFTNASYTNAGSITIHEPDPAGESGFAIKFSNGEQYSQVVFKSPDRRDLSKLRTSGYWLEFKVRGTSGVNQIEVRFLDSKTGTADHPWRSRVTLNSTKVTWNDTWQTVKFPLSSFVESGSWDGSWFDPKGLFDWKDVERLEFVAENQALTGQTLYLDDIKITNGTGVSVSEPAQVPNGLQIVNTWPNPFNPEVSVQIRNGNKEMLTLVVFTVLGQIVRQVELPSGKENQIVSWDGKTASGIPASSGTYLLKVMGKTSSVTTRVILMK